MMPLKFIGLKLNIKKEIYDEVICMDPFTDSDFIEFMESFNDGQFMEYENGLHKTHKFYDTITELSRSDTVWADPLVKHDKKMYGLDWIVKNSKLLSSNPPKTTDALFYSKDSDGNLSLHLIEFKFIGMKSHKNKINYLWNVISNKNSSFGDDSKDCFDKNFVRNFRTIKQGFKDPIDVSFQLKPYESIFIVLPRLYDEYCEEHNECKKDFKSYLAKMKKYYWIVIGNDSQSEDNLKGKTRHFNKYNKRLEKTIFFKARAKTRKEFLKVLDREILGNFNFDN